MATGNMERFAELRCIVLNRKADLDFKIIIFTFGIFFSFCSIKQDFEYIHSFLLQIEAS